MPLIRFTKATAGPGPRLARAGVSTKAVLVARWAGPRGREENEAKKKGRTSGPQLEIRGLAAPQIMGRTSEGENKEQNGSESKFLH